MLPIRSARALREQDMVRNDALPRIEADPQTLELYADGKRLHVEPVTLVPLNRKYLLR